MSEASSKMSTLLDSHECNNRVMNKQIEARLRLKGRLAAAESMNQMKRGQNNDLVQDRELTSWECWASSKADYLKNKKRMERPIALY